MNLAQPLTRLTTIGSEDNIDGGFRSDLLTQRHTLYDSYSIELLLQEVSKAYTYSLETSYEKRPPAATLVQASIKQVTARDRENANYFWTRQFLGIEAVPFPCLPDHRYYPCTNSAIRRNIYDLLLTPGDQDVTASTAIRAAWSILATQHTGPNDEIFEALITGRQDPIEGIEDFSTPLIDTLLIRITLDSEERMKSFLRRVHQQSVDMIAHEHIEFPVREAIEGVDGGDRLGGGCGRGAGGGVGRELSRWCRMEFLIENYPGGTQGLMYMSELFSYQHETR